MNSFEPTLALRLEDYDLSEKSEGLIFGIMPLTYTVCTLAFPYVVPSWVPYRVTLFVSLIIITISTLMIGPVFAKQNLISMLVGLGISGGVQSMMVIPNMPEMMQACKETF